MQPTTHPDRPPKKDPLDARPDLVSANETALADALCRALILGVKDAATGEERDSFEVARILARRWLTGQREAMHCAYRAGIVQRTAWSQAPAPGKFAIESAPQALDADEPESCDLVAVITLRKKYPASFSMESVRQALRDFDFGGLDPFAFDVRVERVTADVDTGGK